MNKLNEPAFEFGLLAAFATISNCWLRNKIKRISRWNLLTAAGNTIIYQKKERHTNLSHSQQRKKVERRKEQKKETLQLFLISFLYFVNTGSTFSFTIFVAIFDWSVQSLFVRLCVCVCASISHSLSPSLPLCLSVSISISITLNVYIAFMLFYYFWKFDWSVPKPQ